MWSLPVFEAFDDGTIVMGQYNSGDLVITGNKVGIGTSAPSKKLEVRGDVLIKGPSDSASTHSALRFQRGNAANDFAYIGFENLGLANDDFLISAGGNGNPLKFVAGSTAGSSSQIMFFKGATEAMQIDNLRHVHMRQDAYVSGNLYVSGSVVTADGTSPDHISGLSGCFGKVGIGTSSMEPNVHLLVDGYALGAGGAGGEVRLRAGDGSYFTHFNQDGLGNHVISMVNGGSPVILASPLTVSIEPPWPIPSPINISPSLFIDAK